MTITFNAMRYFSAVWFVGHDAALPLEDRMEWLPPDIAACLMFPQDKPPAFVTLDDRALTFTGEWPDVQTLLAFQPWTRNTPPPHERPPQEAPHA